MRISVYVIKGLTRMSIWTSTSRHNVLKNVRSNRLETCLLEVLSESNTRHGNFQRPHQAKHFIGVEYSVLSKKMHIALSTSLSDLQEVLRIEKDHAPLLSFSAILHEAPAANVTSNMRNRRSDRIASSPDPHGFVCEKLCLISKYTSYPQ